MKLFPWPSCSLRNYFFWAIILYDLKAFYIYLSELYVVIFILSWIYFRVLLLLRGVPLPLLGEMMSFISYLQNWLTDTSESHTSCFSSLCRYCCNIWWTFLCAEIEQVDTQDCSELEYELVMWHHWPILIKFFVFILL